MSIKSLPALSYDDAYRLRHYLPPPAPADGAYLPYPNHYAVSPERATELKAEWFQASYGRKQAESGVAGTPES